MKRAAFEERLRQGAPFLPLNGGQVEALWRHYELLARWNARMNLTRVVELEEAIRVHYVESLFVAAQLPLETRSVADLGSGAGFPGFVVAVARPELQVTLIESDQRKAAFLREASDLAPNVRVVATRGREVAARFDVVLSRAVRADDVVELARRTARWVMLVGTEPPDSGKDLVWESVVLPGGRGVLWRAALGG
ncbi:MAG: hypothetical protein KatS3mg004_1563 [Bryobacteraceae bacterium]|nr:MAG: hypothetical protein KatS3mg004_1563 [Bryobacteraceae bacterium]